MGVWADLVRTLTTNNVVSGRKNTAANLRTVYGGIADALQFLEGLTRGSFIFSGEGEPDSVALLEPTPKDGDAYLDTVTGDLYLRVADDWGLKVVLRGKDGKDGKDGNDGRTPVAGVDFIVKNGVDGKSAYQVWLDQGNQGSPADFFNSFKGRDGVDGVIGNKIYWQSLAPTTESGNVGDMWYHAISETKYAIYECRAAVATAASLASEAGVVAASSNWRLRFTSPDPVAGSGGTGGTAGVATFNSRTGAVTFTASDLLTVLQGGTLSPDGTKVIVSSGGSSISLEQNLSSNSTTAAPSVAAVKSAVEGSVYYHEILVSVTQTTNRVPIYFRKKVLFNTQSPNYNVASVSYTLAYYDQNGDEVKFGPFSSFGGNSGLNASINALPESVVTNSGYTVLADFALKPGRSSAESVINIQPII